MNPDQQPQISHDYDINNETNNPQLIIKSLFILVNAGIIFNSTQKKNTDLSFENAEILCY